MIVGAGSPLIAAVWIVGHVAMYNAIASTEWKTGLFSRAFGRKLAVYLNASYIIAAGLIRVYLISESTRRDMGSMYFISGSLSLLMGCTLMVFGVFLNLWTLKFLEVASGDPDYTTGPFKYHSDPQYVGATFVSLGYALYRKSFVGIGHTAVLALSYYISVKKFERPRMKQIYGTRQQWVNDKANANMPGGGTLSGMSGLKKWGKNDVA
ncbi:hypothetical protein BJ742DRAFT_773594 [Cladochytrium replicatum]|nr:hypothetical protein BJ742DRAFT_773594 [Cladochytrium replicatum]